MFYNYRNDIWVSIVKMFLQCIFVIPYPVTAKYVTLQRSDQGRHVPFEKNVLGLFMSI